MDDETPMVPEESTAQPSPSIVGGTYHAAAFNTASRDITMIGCATTSNFTFTTAPAEPCDFRRVRMGDIDLQREIHVDKDSCVVDWHPGRRRSARRMYSATIDSRKSSVTVAIYQGDGAEEEWRHHVAKYMMIRQVPPFYCSVQSSSKNIHAAIFHDDLIPFQHLQELCSHSPMLAVFIHAWSYTDFEAVRDYLFSAFQLALSELECTFWIRRSTGQVCVDLIPSDHSLFCFAHSAKITRSSEIKPLDTTNQEATVIDSLTLAQYHNICSWDLPQFRSISFSPRVTFNLGAVICCSPANEQENLVEIAFLPNVDFNAYWSRDGDVMKDGWTRYNSGDVVDTKIWLRLQTLNTGVWLSQANHIFNRLRILSNFKDYVFVDEIQFRLKIPATTVDLPDGYLFLCPKSDFKIGPLSFEWPDCPAYWSLDSSGVECLSMEQATELGFPSIQLFTEIWGKSWDASVYAGLRQFHQAKGFDPDSQEVARHLNKPLYRLSKEMNVPFAHNMDVDEESEDRLGPAIEDYVHNIRTAPAERPLEDTLNTHENTMEQAPKRAAHEDDLALRRLILDAKAQLIELHRLGIYTKEELIAQLAKLEERYEAAAQPIPATRPRLSNVTEAGSSGGV
ncbi:hypothetical protein B0H19DRAFT_1384609 [Mycena capillaripes]|nr:hypothetical protein B0H19DRAFT_1384609 [Mycena capillaripes]